jgi:hypothetical protein
MSRHDWVLVFQCGHRYFASVTRPGCAVADESGEWPEDTDDGIAWLDKSRHITFKEGQWYIPLTLKGEPSKTPATWHEVVAVANLFRMWIDLENGKPKSRISVSLILDAVRPCESCGTPGAFRDHQNLDDCP